MLRLIFRRRPVRTGASMAAEQFRDASVTEALIARAHEKLVPGRSCGSCTLCCKAVGVAEIAKPGGVWCPHCVSGRRCTIYPTRYASCRTFYCEWMMQQ